VGGEAFPEACLGKIPAKRPLVSELGRPNFSLEKRRVLCDDDQRDDNEDRTLERTDGVILRRPCRILKAGIGATGRSRGF